MSHFGSRHFGTRHFGSRHFGGQVATPTPTPTVGVRLTRKPGDLQSQPQNRNVKVPS